MDVNSKESKVAPFLASCQDWSMVRSIFVQSVFWRVAATLSWALVSLLTLKLFRRHLSLELYGLVGPALQVLGSLPALDGGFRATLNRRMLSAGAGVESDALAAFGQRLYSRLALTATGLGLLLLATYSFTPNAQLMQLPWPFFPLLGSCCGLVVLASSFLQQMTGVGLQRRMFILQLIMAWTSLGLLWGGFQLGAGYWSFLLSQGVPPLISILLAVPMLRRVSPSLSILDFSWTPQDTSSLRALWPESSGVMRMQFSTLLLYTVDVYLVSWIWTGSLVSHYTLFANLFSRLRQLLQSADEAVWPLLAAKRNKGEQISAGVLRFNGWLYGAALAVAAVCIGPFVTGFLDKTWAAAPTLATLFAARYLITGLASQPAWWLYGHGQTRSLAGHMERELLTSLALSLPLGAWLGPIGIAIAFLLGTLAGSLIPLPLEYARRNNRSAAEIFSVSWLRAFLAAPMAGGLAWLGLQVGGSWLYTVTFAGVATGLTLGAALALAAWKARKAGDFNRIDIANHL